MSSSEQQEQPEQQPEQQHDNATTVAAAAGDVNALGAADVSPLESRVIEGGIAVVAEAAPEEESTAVFQPVVQLAAVETPSGEEGEELVYCQRAKVYTYGETLLNKGKNILSWNERGVGDVKLLKSVETGMIRMLMRQEKTLKIVINHQMDPRITIQPQSGSDRAYCWRAFDYSNGKDLIDTMFALKFKDDVVATTFLEHFVQAQQTMQLLGYGSTTTTTTTTTTAAEETTPSGETTSAAEDVAKALAGLSTSENTAEEAKES